MADGRAVGLAVGVSKYEDPGLAPCAPCAENARRIAGALDPKVVVDVRVLTDPVSVQELVAALERAARDARGGGLFFYYAGHALRHGEDVLLTVGASKVDGAEETLRWSAVEALLARERVPRALVILDVDLPREDAGHGPMVAHAYTVMGSTRAADPEEGDARFDRYGRLVVEALERPAAELAPYLDRGRLDAEGLGRFLFAEAPKDLAHEVFRTADAPLVLRWLAPELERTKDRTLTAPQPEVKPAFEDAEEGPTDRAGGSITGARAGRGANVGTVVAWAVALAIAVVVAWLVARR